MTQASFASAGVRRNVLARIAGGGPGFDNDFRIKDRRLFVRDPAARTLLKDAIHQLKTLPRRNPSVIEPIIVQRRDKLPVLVRTWRFDGAAHLAAQETN